MIHLCRYGAGQRPLLPFEPHFSVDVTSSGESSSGFTSQDSTMERCKTEPLWHVPVSSSRGPSGGGGQRRVTRQDVPGKDSPNRHSKGETQYSSHSSSNTMSSNASSSHSDERWFDVDPDPDLNKGGSNDSGIDASTHYNNNRQGNMSNSQTHKPMHSFATYSGVQELSVGRSSGSSGEARRRESSPIIAPSASQNKGYRTKTFPPPGSSADKMDAFKPRAFTPQGYKTPTAEKARHVRAVSTNPTSAHLGSIPLSSSAPKAFYGKSRQTAWQNEDNGPSPSNVTTTQVDTNSKNVFGQPRLRASLRDLRSPRRTYKSTIEDDLKKLIIMDNPGETPQRDPSPRRTLQRTFSDESLCSGRREASFANSAENPTTPTDVLFTCTLPMRKHAVSSNQMQSKKGPLSASELSLTEVRDKVPPLRRLDLGLMPLPDTACGLEWSSLVNAAKAYEAQRAVSLFSLTEPQVGGPDMRPVVSPVQNTILSHYCHLVVMHLTELNPKLEKKDKVFLLAEMANLRENNQRLQVESHTASEQLRKFSTLFTNDKTESEHEAHSLTHETDPRSE
uniref:Signal-induced proliferation-associated 1-like protein C-terminal domain-containing protein n=1 Tax=Cyclopterus lumpus TaxID=8103 RepID=A0A8C2ZWG0_CYCLU